MGQTKNYLLDKEFAQAFEDENVQNFLREQDVQDEEQMIEEFVKQEELTNKSKNYELLRQKNSAGPDIWRVF